MNNINDNNALKATTAPKTAGTPKAAALVDTNDALKTKSALKPATLKATAILETSESLAANVLKQYGISPEGIELIQGGTIKTVWKFGIGGRSFCLKRLKQTLDKALFSVNGQIFIKNSGGLVPWVVLNMAGEPVTQYNKQLFVVYEWINGKDMSFSLETDLKQAIQGLAHFHIASKGYNPPETARISTKLGKWPNQYMSMKKKLASWMEIAVQGTYSASYSAYLSNTGKMIALADMALETLASSAYNELARPGTTSVVLCHQDYGKGNALAAPEGIYVLDLDGVTYDLPARDLRKIIGKNAENRGQWSAKTISDILDWYTQINPLNKEELQVLLADLTFPHWFYGLVKNQFQNGKSLKASEIEKIARLESSKEEIIKLCIIRSD